MHFPEQWQLRKPSCSSPRGVVAAQHYLAAEAGVAMLAQGGNAADAAVACAFALNAVEPWMSGLGGSGYAVIWRAAERQAYAVNFQGTVPNNIDPTAYPLDPEVPFSVMGFPGVKDNCNVIGYGSITVPGAVAGLGLIVKRFGQLGFDRILVPAIDLAEQGLPVDWHATLQIGLQQHELARDPGAAALFLPNGYPPQPATRLPLSALAATLRALADKGPREFYQGALAEQIIVDLQAGGSAIDWDDLVAYEALIERPCFGQHRGVYVYGADVSSGAQRLLDTLAYSAEHLDPGPEPDERTFVVYAQGLNEAFTAHYRRTGLSDESGCTTHISSVDAEGNMVALTYTLLNRFGSQVVLPRTGILMNNAISYFDPRSGRPTSLQGGKRINSSNMCPIIAVRNETAIFALGASGANYIVPAVTQLTALILDYGMDLEQAFHTPRIDAGGRADIRVDPALPDSFIAALAQEFVLDIAPLTVFPKLYACPSGVQRDSASGLSSKLFSKLYSGMTDPSSPIAAARGLI